MEHFGGLFLVVLFLVGGLFQCFVVSFLVVQFVMFVICLLLVYLNTDEKNSGLCR